MPYMTTKWEWSFGTGENFFYFLIHSGLSKEILEKRVLPASNWVVKMASGGKIDLALDDIIKQNPRGGRRGGGRGTRRGSGGGGITTLMRSSGGGGRRGGAGFGRVRQAASFTRVSSLPFCSLAMRCRGVFGGWWSSMTGWFAPPPYSGNDYLAIAQEISFFCANKRAV